ncbi:MAG: response regulator [Gammaproteobacteria bacterium]|nr:response regulator [Gammaproteobacteria bacterium]
MNNERRFAGIARRLTLYFLFFSLLLTLPAAASYWYWAHARNLEQVKRLITRIQSNHVAELHADLEKDDMARIRERLENILRFSEVRHLELRRDGKVLLSAGLLAANAGISRELFLSPAGNGAPASLYLSIGDEDLQVRELKETLYVSAAAILVIFLISVLLFFLFRHMVSRHLLTIAHYAQQSDTRKPEQALTLPRNASNDCCDERDTLATAIPRNARNDCCDELGTLATAINSMRVRLYEAYQAVHENEERFDLALQASKDGIYDWDIDTNNIYFSRHWKEMLGYAEEEIGNHADEWFRRVHADDISLIMKDVKAHLDKETPYYDNIHRVKHKDGHYLWVHGRGIAVWDENGDPYRMVGINHDITEERRSEETLNRAKEMAESANLAKSQFIANMSHELRTPLNAIIGYSEMLKEDAEDLEQYHFVSDLEKIFAAGRNLLSLINDVLDISKIEAGKMELYNETFEVNSLIDEVVNTIQPLITSNGNRLKLERGEGLGVIYADLTKVRQTLLNLLSNASKFSDKGIVTLAVNREVEKDSEWIVFVIRDTGIGITPEQQKKLFQAFTQADASTTRKYGGTGLGLVLTKRFSEMMGGTVSVKSEYGQGSAFTVRLPANIKTGKHDKPGPASQADAAQESEGMILVIDDDLAVRDLLKSYITKLGYQVATASNGDEGLRLARKLHPDAITLDVMMPGMDGWMVLSALKNDPALADVPVIMASIIEDKGLGYSLGAAEYLTKPINSVQLGTVLNKYRGAKGDRRLVMVVEDDVVTRDMMQTMLRKAGWRICTAENGRTALAYLQEHEKDLPDLILLDLMMPEMDGFEFVNRLREEPAWRTLPVVVLTAKDITLEDRVRLDERVQNIFQKGAFRRDALLGEIRDLLAKAAPSRIE